MSFIIKTYDFGRAHSGARVTRFRLEDTSSGAYADILDMGCTVRSAAVPDAAGAYHDFVLGFDAPECYEKSCSYMGAVVGRVANRIAGARFTLMGKEYAVPANEGENCLHGGGPQFSFGVWDAYADEAAGAVRFMRISPDGECGFPGRLEASVTYRLRGRRLSIEYGAVTDAPTVYNPTNHAYFTLGGKDITNVYMRIASSRCLEMGSGLIPTGRLLETRGTPADVNALDTLGDAAFDHCFVLDGESVAATAVDKHTGLGLRVFTDRPALQLYTADGLNAAQMRGGYGPRAGFCLETQGFTDAVHHANFPPQTLLPGERFESVSAYEFFTD